MHKIFTKYEMYSINIYDRKTDANISDIENIVCELIIMKLSEPYNETFNIFSVYILSEDGILEKRNGARNFVFYNNIKEYSRVASDKEKDIFSKLMSLDNTNETDNFDKAENLIQELENSNEFLFFKDVKETAHDLFDKHGFSFVNY